MKGSDIMGIASRAVKADIILKAKKKASEQNWELHNIRMLTDHPDDHYLMVVRCYIPVKKEWFVGLYNSDMNGFAEGYYTTENVEAITKYWDKQ